MTCSSNLGSFPQTFEVKQQQNLWNHCTASMPGKSSPSHIWPTGWGKVLKEVGWLWGALTDNWKNNTVAVTAPRNSHGYPKLIQIVLWCRSYSRYRLDVNIPYSKPQFSVLPFPKHDSLMVVSGYFPTICICKENFKRFTLTIATGHLQDRCCWRCRPPDIVKIIEPLVMWIETTPKIHCPISSNRHSVREWLSQGFLSLKILAHRTPKDEHFGYWDVHGT